MEVKPYFAVVDGTRIDDIETTLNHERLQFDLGGRRGLHLYTFNSLMLPIASKRTGEETYRFEGPRLGLYHETADIREGPFLNHFLERVEIHVAFPATKKAIITLCAWADRRKSFFDPYWYKGPADGIWKFEACLLYTFP